MFGDLVDLAGHLALELGVVDLRVLVLGPVQQDLVRVVVHECGEELVAIEAEGLMKMGMNEEVLRQ